VTSVLLLLALAGGPTKGIHWDRNLDEALKKARSTHKPVMIDFWAEWCEWCHRLDETTYADADVRGLLEGFVTVKIDTEGGKSGADAASRFDVDSLPTIVFLAPSGRLLFKVTGFQGPGQFPDTLQEARDAATRMSAWETALEKNPDDAAALFALGMHLFDEERLEEGLPLLDRARAHDQKRPTEERKQTRTVLGVIDFYQHHYAEAETVLREALAIVPVGDYDAKTLLTLGRVYLKWGRPEEARACLKSIVDLHGSSTVAPKAREMLVALDKKP
jgi:thioredoxin-like negative regulator of GroEL